MQSLSGALSTGLRHEERIEQLSARLDSGAGDAGQRRQWSLAFQRERTALEQHAKFCRAR
jgi:hypothetical protein